MLRNYRITRLVCVKTYGGGEGEFCERDKLGKYTAKTKQLGWVKNILPETSFSRKYWDLSCCSFFFPSERANFECCAGSPKIAPVFPPFSLLWSFFLEGATDLPHPHLPPSVMMSGVKEAESSKAPVPYFFYFQISIPAKCSTNLFVELWRFFGDQLRRTDLDFFALESRLIYAGHRLIILIL